MNDATARQAQTHPGVSVLLPVARPAAGVTTAGGGRLIGLSCRWGVGLFLLALIMPRVQWANPHRPTASPPPTAPTSALWSESAGTVPLRVDINANRRADMQTEGWENWLPTHDQLRRTFGEVTVTLRAGQGSSIRLQDNKALVVHGLTVGADGVVVTGGHPAALEVQLDGLTPGPHTFVGFHHLLDGAVEHYTIWAGHQSVGGVAPSIEADHNDDIGSSFIAFEAEAGRPVVIRIAAGTSGRVMLNGFALDVSDPKRKARRPVPADFERHADGDCAEVVLRWTPAPSAVRHHVYLVADRDPLMAARKLACTPPEGATFTASVENASCKVPVSCDSLLHYLWRVDTIDAQSRVTRGDIWRFRVRHPAFPSAEGYGRFALGGRGGRVLHVTTLEDSGPGSLREAVEATGPRTIVFDVSGIITLKSKLIFRRENEFLTIAGQTAPGKGICIRNFSLGGLGARDVIVRFIRVRVGDLTGQTMDGMGLAGCDHCIIDHCSISWSVDEAFSSRGAKNITFQRNLISEALNIAGHRKYAAGAAHGFAASISGDIGSFHHNLLAHNAGRNWSLAGGIDQANRHAGRLDIRHNVVYNWCHRTTDGGARQVQFVNNYYKPGPASVLMTYLNPQLENPAFGPQQYYVAGNILEGVAGPEGPSGPFKGVSIRGHQSAPVLVAQPFCEPHVKTQPAREAFDNVLANVGCNVPQLDQHDQRVIEETRTGIARFKGSKSGLPGLPDSQQDVGGWEDYPEVHRPAGWDTDRDGMPDAWEIRHGLDPSNPADGHDMTLSAAGYTHLEMYLNELAGDPVKWKEKGT